MTQTVTRTYHHEPLDGNRYEVWFVETVTEESRTWLGTADGIAGRLRLEDAHKNRHANEETDQ